MAAIARLAGESWIDLVDVSRECQNEKVGASPIPIPSPSPALPDKVGGPPSLSNSCFLTLFLKQAVWYSISIRHQASQPAVLFSSTSVPLSPLNQSL